MIIGYIPKLSLQSLQCCLQIDASLLSIRLALTFAGSLQGFAVRRGLAAAGISTRIEVVPYGTDRFAPGR
jgi:hypothetical protein